MDTLLQRPANAFCLYVMAHGAGAGMRHPFLQAVADALETLGMATLRYESGFSAYSEVLDAQGGGGSITLTLQ